MKSDAVRSSDYVYNMTPSSGTSSATDNGSGDSNNGCEPANSCMPHCWTVRCVLIKAHLLFLQRTEVLLNVLILFCALFSICYQKPVPKCSENLVENEVEAELQKLELDSLLPDVKGRILEHLDHEDIFKLKSLSKNWKALIESVDFIQALALKAKPVLTACSFFIDKGVWQWAAFDPNWKATSGQKGKWRKLPPLTFLPPNCDPDPDLFKQFLVCASEGLVCMNFSKSPQEERLIVFNPLTEQWKELPPLLHRRNPVLMHMYVDQSSKSYHILAAGSSASGEESLSRITESYDSRTGQWERVGDLPGPAFALNEYQSGVFRNGHIFCIGFLELGDQTVKGILGYNVEEGLWSTKWTAEALPTSSILQLVENNGDLFLFSERDNGPLIEHWVDRLEWTRSEGDNEEKTDILKLVNVLKKVKSGGRSLEVYPEFALVPFSESQVCIYNAVDHTGEVYGIEDEEKCEALPAFPEGFRVLIGILSVIPEHSSPHRISLYRSRSNFLGFTVLHDTTRARMISAPGFERFLPNNPGQPFGCSILGAIEFLTCLSVVGACPNPAPGPSTYPTVWYWAAGATIAATAIVVIGLGVRIFRYFHRREREDNLRGVLQELTRPFRERARGMCMFVGSLQVGEASVDNLRLRTSPGSSPGSPA